MVPSLASERDNKERKRPFETGQPHVGEEPRMFFSHDSLLATVAYLHSTTSELHTLRGYFGLAARKSVNTLFLH